MTTLTFKQTGDEPEYLQAGCSSLDLPDPNVTNRKAIVGASGSATQITRTITGSDAGADSEVMLAGWSQVPSGVLGGETWEAGDWICRLNVTVPNTAIKWQSVYICGLVGSDWTTIASKTDVNILFSSAGTKVVTLTTVSATDWSGAASSPSLYWLYGFQKSLVADQTFKFRSNKNLVTPIVAKVAVPVVALTGSSIAPTLGVGVPVVSLSGSAVTAGLGFPVPAVSLAGSGLSPGLGVAAPVVALTGSSIAPTLGLGAPVVSLAGSAASPGLGVGAPVVSLAGSGLSPGLGMAVPAVTLTGSAVSSTLGFAVPAVALAGSVATPQVLLPSEVKAPPRSRIASSGIEVGASVAPMVAASRFAGSAVSIGASSSSTLAASRFSWSGQRLGTIPYGALVAGRAFSSEQRLAAVGSPDPVVSRSIQTGASRGGIRSSGVVAAAISSSGVEFGGVNCAD